MNTIKELKAKEKYDNMLKRKNKEIERLKENAEFHKKSFAELHKRMSKAIDKLEESQKGLEEWHFDGYDPDLKEVIELLRSEDDEI